MKELAKLKGTGSTLFVYEECVTIKRSVLSSIGSVGDKTFPYGNIGSVVFRKPRWFSDGYMQFISSGNTADSHSTVVGAIPTIKDVMALARDPDVVVLSGGAKESEDVYNLIMKKIQTYNSSKAADASTVSGADELEKFASLRQKGIITNEEFEAKKKQILNS